MKKLILTTLVIIFLFSISTPNVKAAADYGPESLLALYGVKDAAVYYIGSDGKKYVFPDLKTYKTWYKNFDRVIRVSTSVLDQYPDGGAMPYRPGVKLITHPDTTRVYAVGPNGFIHWIPTESVAGSLYGANWQSMVQDVLPGYFATSYKIDTDISDKYPTGTLLQVIENIYYVDGDNLRLFANHDAFLANNFLDDFLVPVNNVTSYGLSSPIIGKEMYLTEYNPHKACCTR
jgi:hypothetical protein